MRRHLIAEYMLSFFLLFVPKLLLNSSARTKKCKNKQSFYMHTLPLIVFRLFLVLSLCLGAHSKHFDIPNYKKVDDLMENVKPKL